MKNRMAIGVIDISASYPANGRFTPRQREIYEAALAIQEACKEDTIVITETGCENLTPGLPRTIAEIEAFMKK